MDDVSQRIRRVTEDLRAIQEELRRVALRDPGEGEQTRLLDEMLNTDLITDFKTSVDHMRHFLWSYIDAVCKEQGKDVDNTLQAYRMQRVTQMLRVLRERAELPSLLQMPEAASFMQEIQAVASTAVDRHLHQQAAAGESPAGPPAPPKPPAR